MYGNEVVLHNTVIKFVAKGNSIFPQDRKICLEITNDITY